MDLHFVLQCDVFYGCQQCHGQMNPTGIRSGPGAFGKAHDIGCGQPAMFRVLGPSPQKCVRQRYLVDIGWAVWEKRDEMRIKD